MVPASGPTKFIVGIVWHYELSRRCDGSLPALADFSDHQANQMRKALGNWGGGDNDRVRYLRQLFYDGCARNRIKPETTDAVWEMITSFTGYSFCKAHSASYAMVSFQCAYLKAHYPAYFLARVIANSGGFYHAAGYLEEARRWQIQLLPPCVQQAEHLTKGETPQAIRLGFQLVNGLGPHSGTRIMQARAQRPFQSLADLRQRAGLSSDELYALLDAGGLTALTPDLNDSQRAWLIARTCRAVTTQRRQQPNRQQAKHASSIPDDASLNLFDSITIKSSQPDPSIDVPALPAWSLPEIDQRQRAALGTCRRHHPLRCYNLPTRRWRGRDLHPNLAGSCIQFIGIYLTSKSVAAHYQTDADGTPLPEGTTRQESMSFVTLEDDTALVETVWFPETYQRYGHLLRSNQPLLVTGLVDAPFNCINLHVQHVQWYVSSPPTGQQP
jgi:DNA polymerase III alpha subunit